MQERIDDETFREETPSYYDRVAEENKPKKAPGAEDEDFDVFERAKEDKIEHENLMRHFVNIKEYDWQPHETAYKDYHFEEQENEGDETDRPNENNTDEDSENEDESEVEDEVDPVDD